MLWPALLALYSALTAVDPSWVEIVPLGGSRGAAASSSVLELAIGARAVELPESFAGPLLFCVGGGGAAVSCDRANSGTGESPQLLRFEREPGLRLAGTVTQRGRAVPGVHVRLFPAAMELRRPFYVPLLRDGQQGEIVRRLDTDSAGRFVTPPLAPGRYGLELTLPWGQVHVRDELVVPPPAPLRPGRAPEDLFEIGQIAIEPGVETVVQVVNDEDRPVAGARVGASQEGASSFTATSDADGVVRLAGLDPSLPVRFWCTARGHRPADPRAERPPPHFTCRLSRHASVLGTVVAEDGPLAGATVSLTAREEIPGAGREPRLTRTDEEGRFLLAGVAPARYRLTAAAPDHLPAEVDLAAEPGRRTDAGTLELEPGVLRRVTVVDADSGLPIPGARLVAVDPAGSFDATTDRDGSVEIVTGQSFSPVIRGWAEGYAPRSFRLPPDGSAEPEPYELRLPRGGRLRVQVWDEETGAACGGCRVTAVPSLDAQGLGQRIVSLTTGPAGAAESELLTPALYQVSPSVGRSLGGGVSVSFGKDSRQVRIESGGVAEVVFGEPHETLALRFIPSPAPGLGLLVDDESASRRYAPNADGVFSIRRPPERSLTLRLTGPRLSVVVAHVPAAFDSPVLDLPLPQTAVTGRVETGVTELRARSLDGSVSGAWLLSGRDGGFSIPHLPPGEYLLELPGGTGLPFRLAPGQRLDLGTLSAAPLGNG